MSKRRLCEGRLRVRAARWSGTHFAVVALLALAAVGLSGCGSQASTAADPTAGAGTAATGLQLALAIDPNPAQVGPVKLSVEVKDAQGQPVDGATVTLSAIHKEMGHGGISGQLQSEGAGRYTGSGAFTMAGTWRFTVNATKNNSAPVSQVYDVQVR